MVWITQSYALDHITHVRPWRTAHMHVRGAAAGELNWSLVIKANRVWLSILCNLVIRFELPYRELGLHELWMIWAYRSAIALNAPYMYAQFRSQANSKLYCCTYVVLYSAWTSSQGSCRNAWSNEFDYVCSVGFGCSFGLVFGHVLCLIDCVGSIWLLRVGHPSRRYYTVTAYITKTSSFLHSWPSVASKSLSKQLSSTAAAWTGTRMFGTISLFRAVKLFLMTWGRASTSEYPLLPLGMALCLPKGPHNHSCSWSLDYHCRRQRLAWVAISS